MAPSIQRNIMHFLAPCFSGFSSTYTKYGHFQWWKLNSKLSIPTLLRLSGFSGNCVYALVGGWSPPAPKHGLLMGLSLKNGTIWWQNNEIALYICHKYTKIIDIFPTFNKHFILCCSCDTSQLSFEANLAFGMVLLFSP